jgi:hypothetical protein
MWTKVRQGSELRTIRGVPMEKQRLDCDIAEIELYFQTLTENISAVPAAFAFSLDESGFQDWADRPERTVRVPSTGTVDKIEMPVDREVKQSSVLICVAANGTHLRPSLILPRKTIEKELSEQAVRQKSVQCAYQ